MLDQLVESKNNASETKRRFGFLSTTLFTVGFVFLAALTYSLFAKDLGTSDDGLEMSSLVAPVPITNEAPPAPETRKEQPKQSAPNDQKQTIRRDMFESVNTPTKPPMESGSVKDVQSWMKGAKIGPVNSTLSNETSVQRGNAQSGAGIPTTKDEKDEIDEAPPAPKKIQSKAEETEQPKPPKTIVSDGVVNGKATNLVKPQYPPPAKAVRAGGKVDVQVLIDEKGNVVSAKAVSGHQLLRQAAEQAARASKFSPTLLSRVPVKVTGVIVYNFVAQ